MKKVTFAALFLILASCGKPADVTVVVPRQQTPEVVPTPALQGDDVIPEVTFEVVLDKVISKSCAGCHGPNSKHVDFTAKANVVEHMGMLFYRATQDESETRMPPPPMQTLTLAQKRVLADWLIQGMK